MENLQQIKEDFERLNAALDKINAKLDRLGDWIKKTDKLFDDCLELVKRRMEVSGE